MHAHGLWPPTTLLGRLPVLARADLLTAGGEHKYADGDSILCQGDRGDHVFLLVMGMVKVTVHAPDGQDTLLGIRVRGDIVGEMAALEGVERMATVSACGPVLARRIYRNQLDDLMKVHPEVATEITKMIISRLRWVSGRWADITAYDPLTRVSRVLVDIAKGYGRQRGRLWELGVQLSQSEIGSLAGMKLRTTQLQLARLESDGVIKRLYLNVQVIDMPRLEAIANG